MAIQVQCRCGRSMKVRDNAAGKRVRCPQCQKPVRVPEPEIDEVEEVFDDESEDDGDELWGSNDYESDDAYTGAPPPRRSAGSRRRKSTAAGKPKRRKSTGGGVPTAVIIIGAVLAGSVAIGGALYLVLGGNGADAPVLADNARGGAGDAETGGNPATTNNNDPAAAAPSTAGRANATADPASNNGAAGSNANAGIGAHTPSGANAGAPLWVQLSDFRRRSGNGIAQSYQISYRVVSGKADPNKNYVLFVATDLGVMQRYVEVDVIPQGSGSVPFDVGMGMSGSLKAYMALKTGHQDWKPVSGEINIGGDPTTAQRPPTVQEAAGADAQGRMLALANPRFERGRIGRNALVVDFVLQKSYEAGKNYFLVIEGNSGQPVASRISTTLMRTKVGDSDQLGVSLIGPGNFPSGPLRVYVETRRGHRDRDGAERVSNTVTLNR